MKLIINTLLLFTNFAVGNPVSGVKTPVVERPITLSKLDLPTVSLPYGTWRASSYDADRDVYTFSNIRFAKPPVGSLRFAKPEKPDLVYGVQDGTKGNDCVAYVGRKGLNFAGLYQDSVWSTVVNWIVPRVIGAGGLNGGAEDCLFLDVYVPGKVFREPNSKKVPVVNWIYGGAYMFGSKTTTGIYSGAHLIDMAKGDMIFVAANYRLGLYGWLGGPTMEKEATPNAGLYDQRFALEWIRDNIHLFGGDKSQVSTWGESAGASSILHHLTAFGGKQDPLFHRAILMSPAFQPMGDRRPDGQEEQMFQKILLWAGCKGKGNGVDCLRKVDARTLDSLNRRCQEDVTQGTYPFGPAADGNWVRQYASTELLEGNHWKGIESMIVSHTGMESTIYTDGHVKSNDDFDKYVTGLFGTLGTTTGLLTGLHEIYPKVVPGGKYKTQTARLMDAIQDAAFTCNTRYVTQAYPYKTWNMVYGYGPSDNGWHSTDLEGLFLRDYKNGYQTIPLIPILGPWVRTYQSYFVSHALTGDPNTLAIGDTTALNAEGQLLIKAPRWPKSSPLTGENMEGVLFQGNDTFSLGVDYSVPRSRCDFWQTWMRDSIKRVGLAP